MLLRSVVVAGRQLLYFKLVLFYSFFNVFPVLFLVLFNVVPQPVDDFGVTDLEPVFLVRKNLFPKLDVLLM
jgi:hypothetical protein